MARLLTLLLAMACQPLLASGFDHEHAAWTSLLQKHVVWLEGGHASEVDYPGFLGDKDELDLYLASLSGVAQAEYQSWPPAQQLAFLINAYNAFTVKLVTDHYPVASIKDIGGLFRNPWKREFAPLFGRQVSLDHIEHELIRAPGVFDEPRIHFAVNCASIGCPALRDDAFTAAQLEQQLSDSERRFLSDPTRNRFDADLQRFEVSKIFDWYGKDFTQKWGSLEAYLSDHAGLMSQGAGSLQSGAEVSIGYLKYDWRLNERR